MDDIAIVVDSGGVSEVVVTNTVEHRYRCHVLVRVSLTCQACSYHPARALVALDYPELRLPRGTCHVINEMRIICIFDTPAQNRHLNEKQRSEAWDASVSDVARIHRSNEHNEIRRTFFLLYITRFTRPRSAQS